MKVIKPQRLGLLHKLYVNDGQPYLSVAVFVLFPFEQPERLLPEMALWMLVADQLGGTPLDEGMNKAHGEVLVHGSCFTPQGKPQGVCAARVAIGNIDKTLYAIGDRTWHHGAPTEPTPFTEMPLTWEGAFGGDGFAHNPIGKGFPEHGVDGAPLPNVELAGHLIASTHDRPEPAAFAPIAVSWPQRASKMGTYDERWLKTRFPGFAEDIDWTTFNVAPPDQHIEGFFAPDTPFVLEHMHPEEPRQQSHLPRVHVRCFTNRQQDDGEAFEELPTRIDTVHLFPHLRRGIAVYRGIARIREDDGQDVLQMLVAAESPDASRPVAHYQELLQERLNPANAAVLLRESGLLPPEPEGEPQPEEISEMGQLLTRDKLRMQNLRRGAQKRIDALRAELADKGMDTSELQDVGPLEPLPPREQLGEHFEELRKHAHSQREEATAKREAALDKARALCEEHDLDFDAMVGEAEAKRGGPPSFSAEQEWERMQRAKQLGAELDVELPELEARLADPELGIKLQLAEQKMKDAYRKTAHLQPPAAAAGEARALELRDDLVMRVAAGIDLDGRDLTGADLSGLHLAGADLRGAFLEGADLSGADLSGAKLDRAVIARAKLDGANLTDASLQETNLGEANLANARACGADLRKAELSKADLTNADLGGADLTGVRLLGTKLEGVDLGGAQATQLTLLDANLAGAKMRDADLTKGNFLRSTFDGVDFSGATLTSATFLEGSAEGATLRGARLDNLRVVRGATFAGADFHAADLAGANLRDAKLTGADFTEANLEGADLSGADLTDAKLGRAHAHRARFARADLSGADLQQTNLMESILQLAAVPRANFSGANLFRADLARMKGDDHTTFEGALLDRVRTFPPRKKHEQS